MSTTLTPFDLQFPKMRVGRFSIKSGEIIPLHLHLEQDGFVYIVDGVVEIKTFTVLNVNKAHYSLELIGQQQLNENDYQKK